MSTTIDQRVVEMRFDNQNFEKNVANSMSTLDKLKQKLNLTGASKGLEQVDRAAKNVDMSGLGRSVETISAKFSAMQIVGTTALVNLTNSAMQAGKRMVESLTIDPVKTGLSEYETKINAIQVIKANTRGKNTMDDIKDALEELNLYADRTIYNFAQMTDNVGKFVAQGLDVHQAANAVQGLANLAGASGASAQDMARATYQMSQALGGIIRKIDWNSLRNANMATVELKNTLMDLARVNGIAIDDMIAKKGTFEDTLEEGWLSGSLFTEAMNIYSDVYSEAELKAKGFTDEQVKNFKDLAKMAAEATTEVKTFTQLWDVLKETAQSGWTQTWEAIIGDFETAKKMWTDVQNYFSDIINAWSDARNFVIEGAMNIANPWNAIMEKLGNVKTAVQAITDVTDKIEYFQNVVSEVWRGKYKNSDTGRYELLEAAGYNHQVVQDLVNKGSEYKITIEDIKASHEKFGITLKETTEETESVVDALSKLDEETLRNAGLTENEIRLYRDLAEEAEKSGRTIEEVIDEMQKNDGRTLLIESLKNAWSGLLGIAKALKGAWTEIFPPATAVDLYNLIKGINQFSEKLRLTDKETGKLTDTGEKLQRIFKGVFAILDLITTIASGGLKIAFDLLSKILGYFGTDVLTVAADLSDLVVRFRDWAKSLIDVDSILDRVIPPIKNFVEAIKEIVTTFIELPAVQSIIDKISGGLKKLSDIKLFDPSKWSAALWTLSTLLPGGPILNGIAAFANTMAQFGTDIASNIYEGFSNFNWGKISAVFWDISAALPNIPIFNTIAAWANSIATFGDNINFKAIGNYISDGLAGGIIESAAKVINAIITMAQELIASFCEETGVESPSKVFMAIGGFIIAGLILGLKDGITSVPDTFKTIIDKVIGYINNIDWKTIFALGVSISSLSFIKKLGDAIVAFSQPFEGLGDIFSEVSQLVDSFSKVTKSIATNIKTKALKQLAIALAILVGSVLAIYLLVDDPLKLALAVSTIAVLAGILVGLSVAMDKLSSASVNFNAKSKTIDFNGLKQNLLTIGLTLLMVAGSVAILSKLPNLGKGLTGLILIIAALASLVMALQIIGKGGYSDGIEKIGGLLIKLSLAMLLLVGVVKLAGMLEKDELIKGGTFVAAFLVFVSGLSLIADGIKGNLKGLGGMLLKMSFAMMLMVGVVKLVDLLDAKEMFKGVVFAGAFVLFVKGIVKAAKGAGKNIGKLGGMLVGLSIAMIALVGVCKLAGMLDTDDMINGAGFAAAFVIFVKALVWATKGLGKNIGKLGGTLLLLSMSIGVLAAISIMLGLIDIKDLAQGVVAVGLLSTFMSMMLRSLKGTKDIKGTLIAMTVSIGILVAALVGLAFVPLDKLAKSTASLGLILGAFTLLIKATHDSKNTKQMVRTLLTLSGIVVLLAGLVAALSFIPNPTNGLIAVAGVTVLMIALAGVINILGKTGSVKDTVAKRLYPLVGVMALLAIIVAALSFIPNPANAIPAAAAITILLAAMAGMMYALGLIKTKGKVDNSVIGTLALLGLIVAELGVIVAGLSFIPNPTNAIPAVAAMTILLAAMTGVLVVLDLLKVNINSKVLGSMAILGLIVAGLGAIVYGLSLIPNPENAITSVVAISALMTVMTALLIPLTIIGYLASGAVKGALCLTAMVVPLAAFAIALHLIPDLSGAYGTVKVLSELMGVMTLLLIPLTLIGYLASGALLGVLSLTAMVVPLAAFGIALSLLPDLTGTRKTVELLIDVMTNMTLLLIPLTLIGFLASGAIAGILVLDALIANMAIVLAALGGLSKIPGFNELIADGGNTLALIGNAIGKFVGSIVGGLAEGIAASLPTIGTYLSDFMTNVTPFINGLKNIDESVIAGAGYLAGAIIALSVADLINGITSLLGVGLPGLAADLCGFAMGILPFAMTMKMIDPSAIEAAKTLAELLLVLAGAEFISGVGDIVNKLFKLDGIDSLGEKLIKFAEMIVDFSNAITADGVSVDTEAIKRTAEAGIAMTDLAKAIPRSGGFLQDIVGEKDLERFGTMCQKFGEAIKTMSASLTGENGAIQINQEAVDTAVAAGQSMSDLANAIPKSDGFLQDVVGESDLEHFGNMCVAFGDAIKAMSSSLTGENGEVLLNQDAVDAAVKAGTSMSELANALPKSDGFLQDVVGEKDLETFGARVKAFGASIKAMSDALTGEDGAVLINDEAIASAEKAGSMMAAVQAAIPADKWLDGKISIDDFGKKLVSFSESIAKYSENLSGADMTNVATSVDEAGRLADLTASIAELDGSGIKEFKKVTGIGEAIGMYVSYIAEINSEAATKSISVATKLKDFIVSLVGIDTSGVTSYKDAISSLGTVSLDNFVKAFNVKLPNLSDVGGNVINSLLNGIQSKQSSLTTVANGIMTKFTSVITSRQSLMQNTGSMLLENLLTGMNSRQASISSIINGLMTNIIDVVRSRVMMFKEAGSDFMTQLGQGIINGAPLAVSAATGSLSAAIAGIRNYGPSFYGAGVSLVEGFASGISENSWQAAAKASAMASAALQAAKDALGINSPSKEFYEIGDYANIGFVNALRDGISKAYTAGTNIAESAKNGLNEAINKVKDYIDSDIDVQPRIKPVLDLSDVRAGANSLGSIFGSGATIGMNANIGSVASLMNSRQNGGNGDVVSAINKLRKDISGLGGDTYQINGITYDDGSAIAAAIAEITRTALMERRI